MAHGSLLDLPDVPAGKAAQPYVPHPRPVHFKSHEKYGFNLILAYLESYEDLENANAPAFIVGPNLQERLIVKINVGPFSVFGRPAVTV